MGSCCSDFSGDSGRVEGARKPVEEEGADKEEGFLTGPVFPASEFLKFQTRGLRVPLPGVVGRFGREGGQVSCHILLPGVSGVDALEPFEFIEKGILFAFCLPVCCSVVDCLFSMSTLYICETVQHKVIKSK